ncbi:MAG: hypothetical protein HQL11_05125, partial [Candidatus Omnitrophica bacterium]|nr:hypothetical protein [Candidatus Omnitrophota bacterium]
KLGIVGLVGVTALALGVTAIPAAYAEDEAAESSEQSSDMAPGFRGRGPRRGPDAPRPEAWQTNHPDAAEHLDTNDDGTVDRTEWKQGREERREHKAERWADNHPKAAERLDRNEDGRVDKKEFTQGKIARKNNKQNVRARGNNPPGPKGGPGAGPNRRPKR